jgi:hypothetical protein
MVSFPAFLVAKESGEAPEWVRVELNGQPHLAIFSTIDKATTFVASLPKDQHVPRELSGPIELSQVLINLPTVLSCVIDYVPGKGTQRVVRAELLLRSLRQGS